MWKKKNPEIEKQDDPSMLPDLPEEDEPVQIVIPNLKKPVKQVPVQKAEPISNGVVVVAQIPTQQVRRIKDANGNVMDIVSIEEALTELLNAYRRGE